MATRDLTMAYLRLRSTLHRAAPKAHRPDGDSELLGAGGVAIDTSQLSQSPVYVELVNEVTAETVTITNKSAWAEGWVDGRAVRLGGKGRRCPSSFLPVLKRVDLG